MNKIASIGKLDVTLSPKLNGGQKLMLTSPSNSRIMNVQDATQIDRESAKTMRLVH